MQFEPNAVWLKEMNCEERKPTRDGFLKFSFIYNTLFKSFFLKVLCHYNI